MSDLSKVCGVPRGGASPRLYGSTPGEGGGEDRAGVPPRPSGRGWNHPGRRWDGKEPWDANGKAKRDGMDARATRLHNACARARDATRKRRRIPRLPADAKNLEKRRLLVSKEKI